MDAPSYSTPDMDLFWNDGAKFATWLKVEMEVTRSWVEYGAIPPAEGYALINAVNHRGTQHTLEWIEDILKVEARTHHDVTAFMEATVRGIPEEQARWFHYGLTSSDIVDTALGLTLVNAVELLQDQWARAWIVDRDIRYRAREHLNRAHEEIRYGK